MAGQITQKGLDYLTNDLGLALGKNMDKFQLYLREGQTLSQANKSASTNFSAKTLNKLSKYQEPSKLDKYLDTQSKLGLVGTSIEGVGTLADVGLGIWGAIDQHNLYKQQLEHAKEVFATEKNLANRNLANQAKLINEQVAARANLAAMYSRGNYSDAKKAYKDTYSVDGNPI